MLNLNWTIFFSIIAVNKQKGKTEKFRSSEFIGFCLRVLHFHTKIIANTDANWILYNESIKVTWQLTINSNRMKKKTNLNVMQNWILIGEFLAIFCCVCFGYEKFRSELLTTISELTWKRNNQKTVFVWTFRILSPGLDRWMLSWNVSKINFSRTFCYVFILIEFWNCKLKKTVKFELLAWMNSFSVLCAHIFFDQNAETR